MLWVAWDYLIDFLKCIFLFTVRFVSGSSLLLVLVNLGVGTVVFHIVVRLVWFSSSPCMSPGVVSLSLMSNRSFTLIILSVVRRVLVPSLFDSARFTSLYVKSVGQDVSPGKCVLLSTAKSFRKAMKLWDISGSGSCWKVQLDVRDLSGHLDFTGRVRAGTLSKRVGEATVGVASVGALPLGFQVNLGLARGKYLPVGLSFLCLLLVDWYL